MKKIKVIILTFVLLLNNIAFGKGYIFLGPSVGWVNGKPDAVVLGAELTYAHIRKARSSGIHFFDKIVWSTLGFRYFNYDDAAYLPYCEFGIWFLLNLGVGYSYGLGKDNLESHNFHLFVGLPLPAALLKIKKPLFIEPYYRFMYNKNSTDRVHEFGLMVKKGF